MKDDGVSQVLGAIMVVSVMMTTMVMMQNEFVPEWTEEAEYNHAQQIINDLGKIKAVIDSQHLNETGNPQGIPMDLKASASGRWLRTEPQGGSLEFRPEAANHSITAQTLMVLNQNGRDQSLLKESWETVSDVALIEDISSITSLRIRLQAAAGEKLEFKKNAYVRMDLTDRHGEFAGMFMVYVPEKEKEDVWVQVQNDDGEILLDQEFASDVKYKEHDKFWVDTFDPSWPWAAVLNAAESPLSLNMAYDFPELDVIKWPTVSYAATYSQLSATGREHWVNGGSGLQLQDFERQVAAGVIEYQSNNWQLPDSTLVFEHGALINVQEGRSAILMPPSFRASTDGETLFVDLSIPALVGTGDGTSKPGTVMALLQPERLYSVESTTDRIQLRLDSPYSSAWAAWFNSELTSHGLADGSGFTVTEASDHVNITLEGPSTDPRIFDIQFNYWEPQIRVEFR